MLRETLTGGIQERIRQLDQFIHKISQLTDIHEKSDSLPSSLAENREGLGEILSDRDGRNGDTVLRDRFLAGLQAAAPETGKEYLTTLAALSPELKEIGTRWLRSVVDQVTEAALNRIPELRPRGSSAAVRPANTDESF